jgi:hypothetical protein
MAWLLSLARRLFAACVYRGEVAMDRQWCIGSVADTPPLFYIRAESPL